MQEVIFIKTYVNLTNNEFNAKNENELYDAIRGVWRISLKRAENIKYVFAIHKGIIKNIYQVDKWHDANTTKYTTRLLDNNDLRMKGRIEFTGNIAKNMQHFINKDISTYYKKGESNPVKYMDLDFLNIELFSEKISYPDDIEDNEKYIEGAKKQVIVNAYERNPKARKACLEKYGYKCKVCSFDFKKIYGEIGKEFIHVHHLNELSEIKEEYILNSVNDLRPVCPNCHAMLHKKKPAYSISELKEIIIEQKGKKDYLDRYIQLQP